MVGIPDTDPDAFEADSTLGVSLMLTFRKLTDTSFLLPLVPFWPAWPWPLACALWLSADLGVVTMLTLFKLEFEDRPEKNSKI